MTSPLEFEQLLNPAQLEAVRAGDGPLLVLAGAGSGKTRVLTFRIADLLRRGVAPAQILAVTFTNKAAGEMRTRIAQLLGPSVARMLWIGTFHATCSRMLRISGAAIGVDPRFVIYDDDDQRALVREITRALGVDERQFPPSAVLAEISRAKNDLIDHVAFASRAETFREEVIGRLYAAYEGRLAECRALDFDDLLVRTVRLFREHPPVLAQYQDRFRHILVDEYQDTNHTQFVLVSLLARRHRNLCVVGDDDQAIYRWRGADVRNILEFERDYPEARIVALEQNYRSTQRVLAVASAVIRHNPHRHPKTLWTANPEGDPVAVYEAFDGYDEARHAGEQIRAHVASGGRFGEVAILYRTNAQSRQFEEMFLRLGIPYQIVGGVRFYERAEIKDILAYLRLASNPLDEASLRRVLNVPRRGIGDGTVRRIEARSRADGVPLWEAIRSEAAGGGRSGGPPARPRQGGSPRRGIEEFVGIVDALAAAAAPGAGHAPHEGEQAGRTAGAEPVERASRTPRNDSAGGNDATAREVLEQALDLTGYRRMLEAEGTDEAAARLENLDELLAVAQEVEEMTGEGSLDAFLQHLALQTDVDTWEERADRVTLMTLHSAKGLEFPMVILAGLEEGLFPHVRALEQEADLEEERRLCYVGMTRARSRLLLTHARQRTTYGMARPGLPSRFLAEIPPELLARAATPRTALGDWPEEESRPIPAVAVGDRVRHKTFGMGRVLEIDGDGPRAIVTVRFDGVGTKRLALGYAPLVPVAPHAEAADEGDAAR